MPRLSQRSPGILLKRPTGSWKKDNPLKRGILKGLFRPPGSKCGSLHETAKSRKLDATLAGDMLMPLERRVHASGETGQELRMKPVLSWKEENRRNTRYAALSYMLFS